MGGWIVRLIVIAVVIGGGALLARAYFARNDRVDHTYRSTPIVRGDVVSTISATGTLEPLETVDVGAQVAAQILSFGTDVQGKQIDYRSRVKAGMLLARLDDTTYQADMASDQAALAAAEAGVARSQADLVQMQAKLVQARNDWERAQKLGVSEALAASSFDNYKATYDIAQANIGVDEAAVKQAEAAVAQAKASLIRAQRNIDYCTISSPVDGEILDRRVNVGQTVVASLNAPSLFLIARDLSKMSVWVSVNEADIGNIFPGQKITFIVDAFPGETFQGSVNLIRLNAQMTSNVVTYTVDVNTDNSSRRLMPYMTANAKFEAARHEGVLTVPNSALRLNPNDDQLVVEARAGNDSGSTTQPTTDSSGEHHGHRHDGASQPSSRPNRVQWTDAVVYVDQDHLLKPVKVRAGLSDGVNTEVTGDDVQEGMQIVAGEVFADASNPTGQIGGGSPFAPQMRRGSGMGGGGGGGGRR